MEGRPEVHELLCRTRDSVRVIRGLNAIESICFSSPCFVSLFSPSGSKLAVVDLIGIKVLSTSNYSEIFSIRRSNVQLLHFSNCGKYLVSWEKPQEESPNLLIWDTDSGKQVYAFSQKKFLKETWPTAIFSSDSRFIYIKNVNEMFVYRIPEPHPFMIFSDFKITSFFVSPKQQLIITYTGEEKTEGSKLTVLSHSNGIAKVAELVINFVQEVKVIWNKTGNSALVWCQTDVDSTGRSYYGEHSLFIVTGDARVKQVKTTEGPIHDLMWNPADDTFVVIAGFMPATSHFYNSSGNKKEQIAKHHRNTIKWNPFGTLFLIAGFGNLQGDVDIYEKNSLLLVGNCRANSTVYCEWGACGKVFVAATLCPRMRVDNGYCIYKYTGEMLYRVMEPLELWQVGWAPQVFHPQPLTPRAEEKKIVEKKTYKPPGASSGFAERFKAAKESASGKLQTVIAPPADYIPGLAPEPAKKKKKKKKPPQK
jgi:translation initiation factor 2A